MSRRPRYHIASGLAVPILLALAPIQAAEAATSELFISEYIEGSELNKAMEIYNGTGAVVDLAAGGYRIEMYFNGSMTAGLTIDLTGTVADGDVYVLANGGASIAEILAQADQTESSGSGWYNGDDAVVLRKGTIPIDVIGQIGFDPGVEWGTGLTSTQDNTLRRKPGICAGDADGSDAFDPALQWDGYAQDTVDGLGAHTANCVCGTAFTPIYTIQGSGLSSALVGNTVVTEGVVVGDFQNNGQPDSGDLNGFHLQDALGDGDDTTSDGIFVFAPSGTNVAIGDKVRVQGTVAEFDGMTEISGVSYIAVCSTGNSLPAAASIILPVESLDDFEPFEGMRVTFPQALSIIEYFNFDRFGEILLASQEYLTPTAEVEPGSAAVDAASAILLDRITLDDGRTTQNPDPAIHPNGLEFELSNLFRGGDQVQNVTGVLDYRFDLYRVQPTQGADYTVVNPRPAAPDDTGGNLKVATLNTLNYFSTIDTGPAICGPGENQACRGADTPQELERQRAKLIAALAGVDADVVGLLELENHLTDAALQDLVAGLNAEMGSGTYAPVATGPIGTDAIKVALIYRPAAVSLVGTYAILDSTVDPDFDDTLHRPTLAQSFMDNATGGIFTVAVNHFKSKGSVCTGDPDTGDGQGNCNLTRVAAAQALVDWLASDPTGSGDDDVLIIGDLNAYDMEDPIDAVKAGSDHVPGTADDYEDAIHSFLGEAAYAYRFDGQLGYLDHALVSAGLQDEVTGVAIWHINADEPDLIDYDMTFKQPAQDALYAPDAYRSSDHDPIIVGLNVCDDDVAPTLTVSVTPAVLWPANHAYVDVTATVTATDDTDPSPEVTLVSVTSNEPDDGADDGNTVDDIVIVDDTHFKLRAERSGSGTGRVYTVTYQAVDACDNATTRSATVSVPLNQKGKKK